jgi:hypothetical protein
VDGVSEAKEQAQPSAWAFPGPQFLLGLFVVGQIVFLFAANLLGILKYYRPEPSSAAGEVAQVVAPGWAAQEGHVHDLVETLTGLTERWSALTGQPQNWGLFAPGVAAECPFVAVELHWDDGVIDLAAHPPELLLSDNEPPDVARYFRWGNFRLRKFESYLDVVLNAYERESADARARRWQGQIEEHLRKEWNTVRTYLKWRSDRFLQLHPNRAEPRQLVLYTRRYHIPAPDEGRIGWDGPFMEPVARWRPSATSPPDHRPLERYDPVTRRFEWLRP